MVVVDSVIDQKLIDVCCPHVRVLRSVLELDKRQSRAAFAKRITPSVSSLASGWI